MSPLKSEKSLDKNCWVIVPAAGVGRRMLSNIPKQYLQLAGQAVLVHSLQRMSAHPSIREIVLVLSVDDQYWRRLPVTNVNCPIRTVHGGKERCDSVLNGLMSLAGRAGENDWVLVHDAARPCVRLEDIDKLIRTCQEDEVGGLLAMPVRDTMKQAKRDGRVTATVSREQLWHALTPQMFRYQDLLAALQRVRAHGVLVTDEAMAMEQAGMAPHLVEGHSDNIKITQPQDLALAAYFLQAQRDQAVSQSTSNMLSQSKLL